MSPRATSLFVLAIAFAVVQATNDTNGTIQLSNKYFPRNFLFGVGSSSYQIEGAWNQSGKGESIWDRYLHTYPEKVTDLSNGDVACDSYNKLEEDVALLKQLGVNSYRFSISWPRLLPTGFSNSLNPAGVNYYRRLIKALKRNNIEPLVTLYHWDLPQHLQELGGIMNKFFPDWFGDYSRTAFKLFGKDVKYWFTFNEGITFCVQSLLGSQLAAPGANASGLYEYQCSRNVLLAHAKAYHIYDKEFRRKQRGNIGMVIASHWFQPASNSTEDIEAAERLLQFVFGWWAHPLIKGDYPPVMKEYIARRSKREGYPVSRLPEFTKNEIRYMKGTIDIVGVNVYTAAVVTPYNSTSIGLVSDAEVTYYTPDSWIDSDSSFAVAPWSVRGLTKWIKDNYDDPTIMITECGYGSASNELDDEERITFIQTYLSSLREGMEEDKTKVIGFSYWSFLADFEWLSGYLIDFGLVYVDFNSTDRTRIIKDSGWYYSKVSTTRCLVDECVYSYSNVSDVTECID